MTATVESIPLITASILSKKLAAGLDGLVMDVKFGSGAFADSLAMARALAMLEAVCGQFYLAVVVAALVGLRVSNRLTGDRPADE